MRAPGPLRTLSTIGLAFAGLIGGHAIGYAIAVPDVHHRAALVSATGHGYLPSASWASIVLGLAAVTAGVASGYVGRRRRTGAGFSRTASRLVPVQAGAFLLLELFERLASGAPVESFSLRLIVVGVLTQILVALLLAVVLVGLRRAGAMLGREPRLALSQTITEGLPREEGPARGRLDRRTERARAPPLARAA